MSAVGLQLRADSAPVLRVGVLTPHVTLGPEAELPAMDPGRVVTCVARVPLEPTGAGATPTPSALRALASSPAFDDAAELLGRGSLDGIVFPSTSSAFAIGYDAEAALVSRLAERAGVSVMSTCASAVLALRALGAERIALVNPPWFEDELIDLGAAYFIDAGFEVLSSESVALSLDSGDLDAAALYGWTFWHVRADADAIFIGGNGFRTAGAVAELETRLARPILTSNQVLLWHLLGAVGEGTTSEVTGYGRLFEHRFSRHFGRASDNDGAPKHGAVMVPGLEARR
jgi:maleate isomerase